jgi:hypothetical protein
MADPPDQEKPGSPYVFGIEDAEITTVGEETAAPLPGSPTEVVPAASVAAGTALVPYAGPPVVPPPVGRRVSPLEWVARVALVLAVVAAVLIPLIATSKNNNAASSETTTTVAHHAGSTTTTTAPSSTTTTTKPSTTTTTTKPSSTTTTTSRTTSVTVPVVTPTTAAPPPPPTTTTTEAPTTTTTAPVDEVLVPSVVGEPALEASQTITAAGLAPEPGATCQNLSTVSSQSPGGGGVAAAGTPVLFQC